MNPWFSWSRWLGIVAKEFIQLKRDRLTFGVIVGIPVIQLTLEDRGVPLIEDDVYGELDFGNERPRPAKSYDRTGNVMHCSSFSKWG